MQETSPPPFATATLMRLYLQQGHLDSAEAMLLELKRRGEAGLEDLEAALWEAKSQSSAMGSEPAPSAPLPFAPPSASHQPQPSSLPPSSLPRNPQALAPNTQHPSSHPGSARMNQQPQNLAQYRAGGETPLSGVLEASIEGLLRELLERIAQRRRKPKV